MAGGFHHFNSDRRNGIARLNADGTVDRSLDPGDGPNDPIYTVALQPDGELLIGGIFTAFDHVRRRGIARLMPSGTLDTTFMDTAYNQFAGLVEPFSFSPPGFVESIALDANGGVLIGGSFTNLGGHPHSSLSTSWSGSWSRADKIVRVNFARLIGGATPGPGAIDLIQFDEVPEDSGTFTTTLRRVDGRLGGNDALGEIEALVETVDLDAVAGTDYHQRQMIASWPQGSSNTISRGSIADVQFEVPIINNSEIEPDRSFVIQLGVPVGSMLLGGEYIPLGPTRMHPAVHVTILDDDAGKATVSFVTPGTRRRRAPDLFSSLYPVLVQPTTSSQLITTFLTARHESVSTLLGPSRAHCGSRPGKRSNSFQLISFKIISPKATKLS